MAKPHLRPIVIVGDGAFQMSMTELSTLVEQKLNPIIIVLNNKGYATERFLKDGEFNNIRNWQYHKVTELIGGGVGELVETEMELEVAMKKAIDSKTLSVLNISLDQKDYTPGMRRIIEGLIKRV